MAKSKGFDKSANLIVIISAILALLSVVFFILTIFFPGSLDKIGISGFAVAGNVTQARINLTVLTGVVINFTKDYILWENGSVDAGSPHANLTTYAGGGVVLGGWWKGNATSNTTGLNIENIGNVNVTIRLKTGKNASEFLGGTGPIYMFNITKNSTTDGCLNLTTNPTIITEGLYYNVNKTDPGTLLCSSLSPEDGKDAIHLDFYLMVPSDSYTGSLSDIITATATQLGG